MNNLSMITTNITDKAVVTIGHRFKISNEAFSLKLEA